MSDKEIVIVEGARTAFAEYCQTPKFGLFKDVTCTDLGAHAAKAAIQKSKVSAEQIDHVVFGNAIQTCPDAIYTARHVGLKSGVPVGTPALTINRLCGSGVEAVAIAARMLKLNEAKFVLAGGTENMSMSFYALRGVRGDYRTRFGLNLELEDWLMLCLKDPFCDMFMAQTAEKCAKQYGVTRQEQDEFAHRSHQLGARAVLNGVFDAEIVPVEIKGKDKTTILMKRDDHIKPETTLEGLSKLPASFGKDGTVTAGNASGIVDGAAAAVVTTSEQARSAGLNPIGKVLNYVAVGVDPTLMGIGPAPAIKKLLDISGFKQDQIDLFEINEAFAAQAVAVEKVLELDRNKLNVNGGAIAVGHPLAASGTRLLITLLYELKRRGKKFGIASACIGGGQGIAMLVEAL